MSTLTELAQHIAKLYPLQDKQAGNRYRVVGELAGIEVDLDRAALACRALVTTGVDDMISVSVTGPLQTCRRPWQAPGLAGSSHWPHLWSCWPPPCQAELFTH